jgi:selenide,water dikinase
VGRVNEQKYSNVLVGMELFDDAGVVKVSDDLAVVTTVDFFTPVVDDPFEFGAIAAANSLSDIYAMGARPISAINVVGFPEGKIPLEYLRKIIDGGLTVAEEAKMPIVGGHTIKSPEPFYGLSITGSVHPDRIFTNSRAKTGDFLYLTKPIGTGVITTAAKNGKASDSVIAEAITIMKKLNRSAAEILINSCGKDDNYVCAVTDITGYGLLGHLSEMLEGSGKSAIIDFNSVPLIKGALNLARLNAFPGGSRSNLLVLESRLEWNGDFEDYEKLLLSDAQTSGGLLISIKPELSEKFEAKMKSSDVMCAKIGEITDKEKWLIKIEKS